MNVLFNRLLWAVRSLKLGDPDIAPEETEVQIAASMRDDLVEKLGALAIASNATSPEDTRRSVRPLPPVRPASGIANSLF